MPQTSQNSNKVLKNFNFNLKTLDGLKLFGEKPNSREPSLLFFCTILEAKKLLLGTP
jgi:hypothetical protein